MLAKVTVPGFGQVEAYARRRRRAIPLIGGNIELQLQQREGFLAPSLSQLVEGTEFTIQTLATVVSSLAGLQWTFRQSADADTFELATVTDELEVVLSSRPGDRSLFELEAQLRGMAARIVVALEYEV